MTALKVTAEPGQHAIVMTRTFSAARELVFKALTDPTLIPRWWGPCTYTTIVDQMDVRMGGIWRFIQRSADGSEIPFRGVYHQISAPERLVYTFEWEGMPGHILLETITLTEEGGQTTLTDALVFQTITDRDGMVASGMESGAAESWDRLSELLATL